MNSPASQVEALLPQWIEKFHRPVIAIDGIGGSGKTTLTNSLAVGLPGIQVLHLDDFLLPATEREQLLESAADPVEIFEFHWNDYPTVRQAVMEFKNGSEGTALIVEGILMFHPGLLDDLWDVRIYLDGNLETIKKRRTEREKARWGADYISEDDPSSWFGLANKGQEKYHQDYKPRERADLILTSES